MNPVAISQKFWYFLHQFILDIFLDHLSIGRNIYLLYG